MQSKFNKSTQMAKTWKSMLIFLLLITSGIAILCASHFGKKPEAPALPSPSPISPPPLAGQVICVDPGHGGYDGGARCRQSLVWEKVLNLQVAKKLADVLTENGALVIMTRENDTDLCGETLPPGVTKKRQDLQARLGIAQEHHATILVSVHMNEYRASSSSGPQVFYRAGQAQSRLLAGCVQEALIDGLAPSKKREAMAGDYFMLSLSIPSVLVECGFISNPQEEKLLMDELYQARLARAITAGILNFNKLSTLPER